MTNTIPARCTTCSKIIAECACPFCFKPDVHCACKPPVTNNLQEMSQQDQAEVRELEAIASRAAGGHCTRDLAIRALRIIRALEQETATLREINKRR